MVDVFIPTKRDKLGNRFGFTRFSCCIDEDNLLERVNKVWISSYAIRAFRLRFERKMEHKVVRRS